jgi:hypothetical protein
MGGLFAFGKKGVHRMRGVRKIPLLGLQGELSRWGPRGVREKSSLAPKNLRELSFCRALMRDPDFPIGMVEGIKDPSQYA